jgi:predicted negative regulator of RcsB-dependent stress response
MSAQNLFSKKNIQSQQAGPQRGLLEELNLPPGLISFIRSNSRNLQIGLAGIVVLVLAWVFFDYYTEMQEKKGTSLLAAGLQAESTEERLQKLESVTLDYGRTDAARWARIELAHLDYGAGRFEEAATKYREILEEVSAENPLVPLARMNLAQSYEELGQYDEAVAQYVLLKKDPGFANLAYWALGRVYTAKGDPVQARSTYQEFLDSLGDTPDPALVSRLEAKLVSLGTSGTVATPPPK